MREKGHSLNLSLLRILAMLMVLSIHAGLSAHWTRFTYSGKYGVQLFFILSGYLISISLERTDSVKEFYRKRIGRIVPEYYMALILYWFIDFWNYTKDRGVAYALLGWDAPVGIRYILRYFSFFQMVLPSDNYALWNNRYAWWTMSSFMVFYLLAPLFYKYLKGFFRSFFALVVLMAGTPIARAGLLSLLQPFHFPMQAEIEGYCEGMPLMQLYCFFMGIVVYWAVRQGKELIYAVFLLLCFMVFNGETYQFEICLALFVLTVIKAKEIQIPAFMHKFINFMARGSFCVYLIHGGIMSMISKWLRPSGAIDFCILLVCVLVVCYLYYAVYEKTCQYLKGRGK